MAPGDKLEAATELLESVARALRGDADGNEHTMLERLPEEILNLRMALSRAVEDRDAALALLREAVAHRHGPTCENATEWRAAVDALTGPQA